jgi:hypothetical protein
LRRSVSTAACVRLALARPEIDPSENEEAEIDNNHPEMIVICQKPQQAVVSTFLGGAEFDRAFASSDEADFSGFRENVLSQADNLKTERASGRSDGSAELEPLNESFGCEHME